MTTQMTATDDQIRNLRTAAAQAGDHAQALICDIATGDVDPNDGYEHLRIWSLLDDDDKRAVRAIDSRDAARTACDVALAERA